MVSETIMRLRAALNRPGVTRRSLSEKAGIHRNTLIGCQHDDWNPKAKTLIALEPHLPALENETA